MEVRFHVTKEARKQLVADMAELTGLQKKYLGPPWAKFQVGPFIIDKEGTVTCDDESKQALMVLIEGLSARGYTAETDLLETSEAQEENPTDQMKISLPDTLTGDQFHNLQKLVEAKQTLLSHAFGADHLEVKSENGTLSIEGLPILEGEDVNAALLFFTKLIDFIKNAKRVTATEKVQENEKYAFRCFLLRLGFIGTEYKGARKVLMQNLSGSSAFKSGQKKEAAENDLSE